MTKFDRIFVITILVVVLSVMLVVFADIVSKPAHAEGTTIVTVLRLAGQRRVYITLISSPASANTTGYITITDLTDGYVCGKGEYHQLVCVPIDSISSVSIDGVDSLPRGQ